jgi:hypothetical protein
LCIETPWEKSNMILLEVVRWRLVLMHWTLVKRTKNGATSLPSSPGPDREFHPRMQVIGRDLLPWVWFLVVIYQIKRAITLSEVKKTDISWVRQLSGFLKTENPLSRNWGDSEDGWTRKKDVAVAAPVGVCVCRVPSRLLAKVLSRPGYPGWAAARPENWHIGPDPLQTYFHTSESPKVFAYKT